MFRREALASLLVLLGCSAPPERSPAWMDWPGMRRLRATLPVVQAQVHTHYDLDPRTGRPRSEPAERVLLGVSTDRIGILALTVRKRPPDLNPILVPQDVRGLGPKLREAATEIRREAAALQNRVGMDLVTSWDTIESRLAICAMERTKLSLLLHVEGFDFEVDLQREYWRDVDLLQLAQRYGTKDDELQALFDRQRGRFSPRLQELREPLRKVVAPYRMLEFGSVRKDPEPGERDRILHAYGPVVSEFVCRYLEESSEVLAELAGRLNAP